MSSVIVLAFFGSAISIFQQAFLPLFDLGSVCLISSTSNSVCLSFVPFFSVQFDQIGTSI